MMPRKDGTPTAAERKAAERIAGNARYIRNADDAELARLAADECNMADDVVAAQVAAELDRRANRPLTAAEARAMFRAVDEAGA